MKRINLKGLSEVLSAKELKNVMGGSTSGDITKVCDKDTSSGCDNDTPCTKDNGDEGTCKYEKNPHGIWQCRCS